MDSKIENETTKEKTKAKYLTSNKDSIKAIETLIELGTSKWDDFKIENNNEAKFN